MTGRARAAGPSSAGRRLRRAPRPALIGVLLPLLLIASVGVKPSKGETPQAEAASVSEAPQKEPPAGRSGYDYMGAELQALQDDEFANPGLLWVDRGARIWETSVPGAASCADCHGRPESLRGVAATLPRWNERSGMLENLEMQINECRTERMNAAPWPWESESLLATTALVAHQSLGEPIAVQIDGPAATAFAAGRREYERRRGQLDLSCSNCHEQLPGARLRGDMISEGMVNGFPIYRLTWQTLGSRQRMFQWCNEAVRSEPHAYGADEYLALELYLAWRARGLPVESPAVRR